MASIRPFLALCLAGFAPMVAVAKDPCAITGDEQNCVRFIACWGEKGTWLHGRAYGFGTGEIAGIRSDDVVCAGTWTERNVFGFGQADVACDDGDTASVIYSVQDEETGTVVGHGSTGSGQRVTAWSGLHVFRYLRANGVPDGTLLCGPVSIPMS